MSWSKSAVQYTDISTHLDKIARSNVRNATFPSPAEAQRWRARVYMYRTILREESGTGRSKYDRWIFRITKDNPCVVHFLKEYPENIVFGTADGEPLAYNDSANLEIEQAVADPEIEQAMREVAYQAEMDAAQAELRAAMRPKAAIRPITPQAPAVPQTPADPMDYEPPETPDISPQTTKDLGLDDL